MKHKARGFRERDLNRNSTGTNSCPSGKLAFLDRASAKADAARAKRTGRGNMRPYPCAECGFFHIGHKPAAVIRGEVTADEWYEQRLAAVPREVDGNA